MTKNCKIDFYLTTSSTPFTHGQTAGYNICKSGLCLKLRLSRVLSELEALQSFLVNLQVRLQGKTYQAYH